MFASMDDQIGNLDPALHAVEAADRRSPAIAADGGGTDGTPLEEQSAVPQSTTAADAGSNSGQEAAGGNSEGAGVGYGSGVSTDDEDADHGRADSGTGSLGSQVVEHDMFDQPAQGLSVQDRDELQHYRDNWQGLEQQLKMVQDELAELESKHELDLAEQKKQYEKKSSERKIAFDELKKRLQESQQLNQAKEALIESLKGQLEEARKSPPRPDPRADRAAATSLAEADRTHQKQIAALKTEHEKKLAEMTEKANYYHSKMSQPAQVIARLKEELTKEKEGKQAAQKELEQYKSTANKDKKALTEKVATLDAQVTTLRQEATSLSTLRAQLELAKSENEQLTAALADARAAKAASQSQAEAAKQEAQQARSAAAAAAASTRPSASSSTSNTQAAAQQRYAKRIQARDALIEKQVSQLKDFAERAQKLQASLARASQELHDRHGQDREAEAEDDEDGAMATASAGTSPAGLSVSREEIEAEIQKQWQEQFDNLKNEATAAKMTSEKVTSTRLAEREHWLRVVSSAMKDSEKVAKRIRKHWKEGEHPALREQLLQRVGVPAASAASDSPSGSPAAPAPVPRSGSASAGASAHASSAVATSTASLVGSRLQATSSTPALPSAMGMPNMANGDAASRGAGPQGSRLSNGKRLLNEEEESDGEADNTLSRHAVKRTKLVDSTADSSGTTHSGHGELEGSGHAQGQGSARTSVGRSSNAGLASNLPRRQQGSVAGSIGLDDGASSSQSGRGAAGQAVWPSSSGRGLPKRTPAGQALARLFPATKAQQEEMLRRRGLEVKDTWLEWYTGSAIAPDSIVRLSPSFIKKLRGELWSAEDITGTIQSETHDGGKTTQFYVTPHQWWFPSEGSSDGGASIPDVLSISKGGEGGASATFKIYFPQLWVLIFNEEDGVDNDETAVTKLLLQMEVKAADPIQKGKSVWKPIHQVSAPPRHARR